MTIKRMLPGGVEIGIELTDDELYAAYLEKQLSLDIDEIKSYLQETRIFKDGVVPMWMIKKIAKRMRDTINLDDSHNAHARDEVIEEMLRKYPHLRKEESE